MTSFKPKNDTRHGFTLIELLVVISIIGMLASTVLVATNRAREKAKAGAFKKEIQQLQLALQMYFLNHGNSWGGAIQTVTAGGLGGDTGVMNPTGAGMDTCTRMPTSLFADPEINKALDGIMKLYPRATIECLAMTDEGATAKYWTIYITAPSQYSTNWNKWCMDNYLYTFSSDKSLFGNTNGPTNRQARPQPNPVITYCGNSADTPPSITYVTNSPDW